MSIYNHTPLLYINLEGDPILVNPDHWNWLETHDLKPWIHRFSIAPEESIWAEMNDEDEWVEVDPDDEDPDEDDWEDLEEEEDE